MMHQKVNAVVLAAVLIAASAATEQAYAAITASGSFWPDPFHSGDGIVSSELQLGVSVGSTGSVTVTDGDTLTTQEGTVLGYTVGATGNVNVTDSTWIAESAVFVAPQFRTEGTVHLTNSTWTVESNVAMAQGDESTATVTLDDSSSWTTEFGVTIASGEDCTAEVNINSGTWTAHTGVTLGGSGFAGSNGTGTINIYADGIMDSRHGLEVTSYGSVRLDGGTLLLAGESEFEGIVDATSNGGSIRMTAGLVPGGHGLVHVGSGVNFTHCDIEIVFRPGLIPDTSDAFDLFDPIDDVDLAAVLETANTIATPAGWVLDHTTGVLSFALFPLCIGGPTAEASQLCQTAFDFDFDTDVDLRDFAIYQQMFAGSGS